MDLKKFTAVHFIEDNSFEVVPSTWISECQGQAKFPANKPKGFLKLQEQFDAVAEKNWPVWRIEILKSYDTFEKAHKKAERSVKGIESSDLETAQKQSRRSKRLPQPAATDVPSAPLFNLVNDTTITNNEEVQESEEDFQVPIPPATAEAREDIHLCVQVPEVSQLREEFRKFQEESLNNQRDLLSRFEGLSRLMNHILASQSSATSSTLPCLWPLQTQEDLNRAEEFVKDPKNFSNEVSVLKRVGGEHLPKHVYNTLSALISHDLALQIRLTSSTGKVGFKNLELARVVRESVKATRTDASDNQINKLIGTWFRQAPDRKGGSGQRKKAQQERPNGDTEANEEEEDNIGSSRNLEENSATGTGSDSA